MTNSERNFNPMLDEDDDYSAASNLPEYIPEGAQYNASETEVEEREGEDSEQTEATRRRKRGKYGRSFLTDRDLEIMQFIARFKVSNADQIEQFTRFGTSSAAIHRRLIGLREFGVVNSVTTLANRKVWFTTRLGLEFLEAFGKVHSEDCTLVSASDLQYSPTLGHTLAVSHVAAQLLAGTSNVENGLGRAPISALVSEYQIDSEWKAWKRIAEQSAHGSNWLARAQTEVRMKNRPFWTLVGTPALGKQFHNPDLVVVGANGQAVAVEVELTMKKRGEYDRILTNYRLDQRPLYKNVVWLTTSASMTERIKASAEAVKLPRERIRVVPLLGRDGEPFKGSAYNL